jgi:hypothetical protein
MAKIAKPDAAPTIAKSLTEREKVALFCAAADIDHAAVGILASVMHAMEIHGLISREQASRYALTDDGHAVPRAMLSDL